MVIAAWTAPLTAAAITLAIYLGTPYISNIPPDNMSTVVTGVTAGILVWLLVSVVIAPFVSACDHSNAESWEEATTRLDAIRARLAQMKNAGKDVSEVRNGIEALGRMPRYGLHWATRRGYIALWQGIHSAEEALIEATDTADLWGVVEKDHLRLSGAQAISPSLAPALQDIARYMAAPNKDPGQQTIETMPPVSSDSDAKSRLREITAAINAFRDENWAGLVRLRMQLFAAVCLTEVFAYGLLALAVILGVGRVQMIAGTTLFVLAAVVGLGSQLSVLRSAKASDPVDDYGLDRARLLLIPVLSGLAGLGGVVVTATLFNTSFGSLVQAASGARAAGPIPSLFDVFDLDRNRASIIFAIVFGYVPTLLITRLDTLVSTYKSAINSTESGMAQGG